MLGVHMIRKLLLVSTLTLSTAALYSCKNKDNKAKTEQTNKKPADKKLVDLPIRVNPSHSSNRSAKPTSIANFAMTGDVKCTDEDAERPFNIAINDSEATRVIQVVEGDDCTINIKSITYDSITLNGNLALNLVNNAIALKTQNFTTGSEKRTVTGEKLLASPSLDISITKYTTRPIEEGENAYEGTKIFQSRKVSKALTLNEFNIENTAEYFTEVTYNVNTRAKKFSKVYGDQKVQINVSGAAKYFVTENNSEAPNFASAGEDDTILLTDNEQYVYAYDSNGILLNGGNPITIRAKNSTQISIPLSSYQRFFHTQSS